MAEINLSILTEMTNEDRKQLTLGTEGIVGDIYYGKKSLEAGDITSLVHQLDPTSTSDADFEVKINSGSEAWPRRKSTKPTERMLLDEERATRELNHKALTISLGLRALRPDLAHNVYLQAGNGTGWYQYKPEASEEL